jgi:predicted dehydrogenase
MSTRRTFLKKSAAASAALGLSSFPILNAGIIGANEKLVCGAIGVKGMGFADLRTFLNQPNTECAALCDVDANVLAERISDVEKIQGKAPKGYSDFRRMLEHKGLDVIIIGTPDHWHTIPFVNAAELGLDIYCEKPLANTIEECNILVRATNRYGTVAQIGQWQRSDKHWDYAGGMMTDWGVHIVDYALYGMKQYAPKSVMSMGGKFAYPDDAAETPDTQQAIFEFDGFTMLWDHGIGIDGGYYGRTHGGGLVGHDLGTIAYKTGRRLYWDAEKSMFINDKDADRYLIPSYRKPWEVPVV